MFPSGSVEELINFYTHGESVTMNGLWSVLVTPSATDSANFGKRYYDEFNNISDGYWHLAVCAARDEDGKWHADAEQQKVSDTIRNTLEAAGQTVPDACFVFFDANATTFGTKGATKETFQDAGFTETCLVLPLDFTKISNDSFFIKGFKRTHEAILKALQNEKVDPGATLASDRIPYVLGQVKGNLASMSIQAGLIVIAGEVGRSLMEKITDIFGNSI